MYSAATSAMNDPKPRTQYTALQSGRSQACITSHIGSCMLRLRAKLLLRQVQALNINQYSNHLDAGFQSGIRNHDKSSIEVSPT